MKLIPVAVALLSVFAAAREDEVENRVCAGTINTLALKCRKGATMETVAVRQFHRGDEVTIKCVKKQGNNNFHNVYVFLPPRTSPAFDPVLAMSLRFLDQLTYYGCSRYWLKVWEGCYVARDYVDLFGSGKAEPPLPFAPRSLSCHIQTDQRL